MFTFCCVNILPMFLSMLSRKREGALEYEGSALLGALHVPNVGEYS